MKLQPAARTSGFDLVFKDLVFCGATCSLVVLAHAVAYMTHEYSHSMAAYLLGWMAHPLALDYGHPTVYNLLFLGDVGDNVQYEPIFTAGHGLQAAIIALAGVVIGNGVLYGFLYALAGAQRVRTSPVGVTIVYWLALMCAGNVWGYVPIRAITTHADIALAARGLGLSAGMTFLLLIVPALFVAWHFFNRMMPRCMAALDAASLGRRALVIALTAYWFFAFYGADGTDGSYGVISQAMSIVSKYVLFPSMVLFLTHRFSIFDEVPLSDRRGKASTSLKATPIQG
jgi:hypothetical protein